MESSAADEDGDDDDDDDDDVGDASEALDPGDDERLDDDEDVCLVLCLSCPTVAMFLTRRTDRAAPQSMKAKVAPFHNFILERGGALKLVRPANPDLAAWRRLQLTSTGKCWLGKSIIITGEERGQDSCLFP